MIWASPSFISAIEAAKGKHLMLNTKLFRRNTGMPKIFVQHQGEIHLSQADFKAQGGQAAIYVKGSTAYKIFNNSKEMIPAAKIAELSVLSDASIIRPQNILLDARNRAIGYTMRHVENAYALCQTFPKSFRARESLTPDIVFKLVRKLQAGVQHVHSHRILIVDLNELNFLVGRDFGEIYFLDVDSYQTKSFHATALMESVRDRHAQGFNEGTDWFAFAVVSFQMFTGIHPFKGTYAPFQHTIEADKRLDARMRSNISVLHSGVTVPSVCLPFDAIPSAYLDWYEAVLENGARVPPPRNAQTVLRLVATQPQRLDGSNHFHIAQLYEFDGEILQHHDNVTLTTKSIYVGNKKCGEHSGEGTTFAVTPRFGHVISVGLGVNRVRLFDVNDNRELKAEIAAEMLASTEGRIYLKQDTALLELAFVELSHAVLPHVKTIGNLAKNATQMFEGVAIQNLLGAYYVSLLPHAGVCHQRRLAEIDNHRIIDAKFSKGVLVIVGAKEGKYDKFIIRFDDEYREYDVRVVTDVQSAAINMTILDNGVSLNLNDRDELEIFSRHKGSVGLKIIADKALRGDCKLSHHGAQALFAAENKLYKFTVRQS